MFKNKTIWIIGANSDVAVSFIKKYGGSFGKIVLASRTPEKTAATIADTGCSNADTAYLDLADAASVEGFLENAPTPFGILFFAGHIEYADKAECSSVENVNSTIMVNYTTPIRILESTMPKMYSNNGGFVALLSSAGDIRGKFSNRFYVSSKKAISTYLEGLMQQNEKHNVKTMIFKFGHINTKMLQKITDHRTPVFVASPEKSADFIFKALQKNKSTVAYYRPVWKILAKIYSLIPLKIYKNLDM